MTMIADQVGPRPGDHGPILPGQNHDAPVLSNVKTFSSEQQAVFDVITIGTEKVPVQKSTQAVSEVTKALVNRRLFTPGQFSKGSVDYSNRPSITVVKVTGGGVEAREEPVGSYSDWFLSSVQEQDMERTDITETFGAPHIFTSGRFTRKMVFSGIVRTTAHNFNSTVTINRVPQHVLLRNFYENFLRSTAQAQLNYFTRIYVDGDIYEGYCIGLQLPRDAGIEMVMQFALSMIVVRRYNVHDSDARDALAVFKTTKVSRLTPSFATAEMKDTGDFIMKLTAGNTSSDAQVSVNLGKVNQDGTLQGVPPVISLESPYSGQTITVSGTAALIWTLKYADDGALVSGSPSRQGSNPLKLELTSYAKLVLAGAQANNTEALTLTLAAKGKDGPSVVITSITSDKPTLVASSLVVVLGNGARYNGVINNTSDASAMVSNARAAATHPSGTHWQIIFDLIVELATFDKAKLPTDAIPAPSSEAFIEANGTVAIMRGGSPDSLSYDLQTVNPLVDTSSVVITSPSQSVLRFAGIVVNFSTDLDMVQLNPFAIADSVKVGLLAHVDLTSYDSFMVRLGLTLDMGATKLIDSLFDHIQSTALKISAASTRVDQFNLQTKVVYVGSLKLAKSAAAQSFSLKASDYTTLLESATITLQYSQGVVACRLNQSTTAQLQLKSGTQQFDIKTTMDASDPDVVLVTIEFAAPSNDKTADLQSVLSSAVSAVIAFPAIYNLPSLPIAFK